MKIIVEGDVSIKSNKSTLCTCPHISIRGVPTCTQIRMCVQLNAASIGVLVTVNPVLSEHSKREKNLNDKW